MNRSLIAGVLAVLIAPTLIAPTTGVFADDPQDSSDSGQPLLLAPPRDATPTPIPDTVIRQRVTPSAAETASPETASPTGRAPYAPGISSKEGAPALQPQHAYPSGPLPGPLRGPLSGELELEPVVLYHNVRIRDPHRVHPLAVPTIIPVPDPRDHRGVVYVEVYMPPCPCLSFWKNRRGTRAEFDFGRYEIDIITRRGVVIIDYDS